MTFYDRYAKIAESQNLDPCSQKAADLFGVTKSALSTWNVKRSTPKGETVAVIAKKLGVSADYLLGLTEDPTENFLQGKTSPAFPKAIKLHPDPDPDPVPAILDLYNRLDDADKLKAEGVIQGMLMQDKYFSAALPNAAHVRTDIPVTEEMIKHDEDIMDSDDF